jgi:hypothetical protein
LARLARYQAEMLAVMGEILFLTLQLLVRLQVVSLLQGVVEVGMVVMRLHLMEKQVGLAEVLVVTTPHQLLVAAFPVKEMLAEVEIPLVKAVVVGAVQGLLG